MKSCYCVGQYQATAANMATIFMFSGQGSQYFQMGRQLFDREPVFRARMLKLDHIARALGGNSVVQALYSDGHGRGDVFARTALTHPAIFMVEYSLAELLIQMGIVPDIVLGSSLGSFVAAAVAGFIEVEDALTAVIRHAITLEACCEPGGMIAVLADPALYGETFMSEHSELASVNFSSHFVVASTEPQLSDIEAALRGRNVTYQRLPVSFAFHSKWIDQAKAPFNSFMKTIRCSTGRLPMMCCDNLQVLYTIPDGYFWDITRNQIRFRDAVVKLDQHRSNRYIDVGPAGTLATFLKHGLDGKSKSTVHSVLTPCGHDQKNLAALVASCAS